MNKTEGIYRSLQKHLDNQAVGYPATKSGVEIRILKRFFSPDEARLAMHMTYKPASLDDICKSTTDSQMSPQSVQAMLRNMFMNGAITRVQRENCTRYCLMPLVVGMAETQLKRMTPELVNEFDEYMSEKAFGLSQLSTELPQLRFVPVGKSISAENHVSTYDQVAEIINGSEGPFAILECFCRKIADIKGQPCKKTSRREVCLALGNWARNNIENGNGRAISREEALKITGMNEADGLVFETSNTQNVEVICSCCGCCCGPLKAQKMLPKPLDFAATNYYTSVNAAACSGCGLCTERCQVNAAGDRRWYPYQRCQPRPLPRLWQLRRHLPERRYEAHEKADGNGAAPRYGDPVRYDHGEEERVLRQNETCAQADVQKITGDLCMHELSIVQNVVNIVLDHAERNGAQKVLSVSLRVGELRDVVDDLIQRFFDYLSKDTIAEEARLKIERLPVIFRCKCGETFSVHITERRGRHHLPSM